MERASWAADERERRRAHEPNDRRSTTFEIGPSVASSTAIAQQVRVEPRAHSTAVEARPRPRNGRDDEERRARASGNNTEFRGYAGQTSNNSTGGEAVRAKMFKVEPFPKGTKPTDQLQEWTYWLTNFEMATEKAGITGQRIRAVELSLHIGEEMRRIMIAKDMMPRESSVSADFPFYDNVVDKLQEHFSSLTDESVDVAAFNAMKQKEGESALEFELRLRQLAKRMKETNAAMIRTRFIEGLRDKDLRRRAYVDGIPMEDVVKMATRTEAIAATQPAEFSPWGEESRKALTVAALDKPDFSKERDHTARRGSARNRDDRSRSSFKDEDKCKNCGFTRHRDGRCPAKEEKCRGCGKVGHYKRMCRQEIQCGGKEHSRRDDEVGNTLYK